MKHDSTVFLMKEIFAHGQLVHLTENKKVSIVGIINSIPAYLI